MISTKETNKGRLKVTLCLDKVGYKVKPDKEEIRKISSRLPFRKRRELFSNLPYLIGTNGNSWCPTTFTENKRSIKNFETLQLFGLDFDGGITWEEVKERADKYRIPIAFAYETFSSVERSKFRVVFCNDFVVKHERVFKLIQFALMEIFHECDEACKDCARLFFGGKGLIYINEDIEGSLLCITDLMDSLVEFYHNRNANYLRSIKCYAERVGVELKNGYPRVEIIDIVEKSEILGAKPIIYTIETAPGISLSVEKKAYAFYLSEVSKGTKTAKISKDINETESTEIKRYAVSNIKSGKRDLLRDFDYSNLQDKCRLYAEFENADIWCEHNVLFGIATNLINISGGAKKYLEILNSEKNKKYPSYKEKDWNYYIDYIEKKAYLPNSCENFCPYKYECTHAKNMIITAKTKRNTIVEISTDKEYVNLAEAEKEFRSVFEKVQEMQDDKIHVIRAQTGIGKTYNYINFLKSTDNPFIIAVPTNELKNEIYEKCILLDIKVIKTPTLELSDNHHYIIKEVERLQKIGAYRKADEYIRAKYKEFGFEELGEYIAQVDMLKTHKGHIITTHARLMFMENKQLMGHEIIIDEDIIKTLMPIHQLDFKDLQRACELRYVSRIDKKKIEERIDLLKSISDGTYSKTEPVYIDNVKNFENQAADIDNEINSNVIGFLKSDVVCKEGDKISYLVKRCLPEMKITILSATADEVVYKLIFGEKIDFHYCKEAKYRGKLIQYPQKSYSRFSIKEKPEILEVAKAVIGDIPVITFKMNKKGNETMNFGNVEGLNQYGGKDLAVIGTPHLNESTYKMYALAMGCKNIGEKMEYQEIDQNGFKFWFMTYKDETLRCIQTWFIKSELEQAIGRARLLRNDCSVFLFSNFPIEQAEFAYI